uniref:AlNc14C89G5640 protein n=1 Tax=Albugo laibachii Nc14 TaxID=890382 RepID=F0WGB0_9STRA|nr:AlNc14C89G5640 [Albugo laibachii Nc14]|eukprot:CCA20245.1 AlNc14C89G5640 [Albugo laibachii Nc14]
MSEELVLLQWLNSNFELCERVVDPEKDLCDGFIFAQILHQSGLEPDLNKYEASPGWLDHNRRVHNMKLLWNRLRIIGHEIPMNLLQCVMKGNRSVIYRVLKTLQVICKRNIKATMFIDGGSEFSGRTGQKLYSPTNHSVRHVANDGMHFIGAERVRNQKQRGSIDMPLRVRRMGCESYQGHLYAIQCTDRFANDKQTDIGRQPEEKVHHLKYDTFSELDEDRIDIKASQFIYILRYKNI